MSVMIVFTIRVVINSQLDNKSKGFTQKEIWSAVVI